MSISSTLSIQIPFKYLLSLAIISPLCTAICYYPDSVTVATQDVPCNGGSSNSVCCGPGYACLSNNVCMRTNDSFDPSTFGIYARSSCTDRNWLSAACPSFCLGSNDTGEGMAKCENSDTDDYCCGEQPECNSNCDNGTVVIRFQGTPTALTTIGVTSTESRVLSTDESSKRTESASPTTTKSRATEPSTVPEIRSQSRTELKVGVGVGVPLGIITFVLAGYVIWIKMGRPKPPHLPPDNGPTYRDKNRGVSPYEARQPPAYQMDRLVRREPEWNNDAQELPVEGHTRHPAVHGR